MGDVLTKAPARGGLGFGTSGSSLILAGVLVGLVLYELRLRQQKAEVTHDSVA
jgi:uncharacterized membrane-anchored protein